MSYETAAVLILGSVDRYQEVRKLGLEKNYKLYFEKKKLFQHNWFPL